MRHPAGAMESILKTVLVVAHLEAAGSSGLGWSCQQGAPCGVRERRSQGTDRLRRRLQKPTSRPKSTYATPQQLRAWAFEGVCRRRLALSRSSAVHSVEAAHSPNTQQTLAEQVVPFTMADSGLAPSKSQPLDEPPAPFEEVLQPAIPAPAAISPVVAPTKLRVSVTARTEGEEREARARKAVTSTLMAMQNTPTTAQRAKRRAPLLTPKSSTRSPAGKGSPEVQAALRQAAEAERREIDELRSLLSKTAHTPAPGNFQRVSDVATNSLRKLDDGQADSIAILRSRRRAEEHVAATATGRPGWDSSVWVYTPPALKGCNPITPEPWAHDGQVYRQSMQSAHSSSSKPRHESMIENAMAQYRASLGTGSETPVSARMRRMYNAALSSPVATPKAEHSAHYVASQATEVRDAAAARRGRIAAKSARKRR